MKPNAPRRLFVAVVPGAAERDALARWQASWSWPRGARIVPPERLHLTLHFLGDTQADAAARLVDALAEVKLRRGHLMLGRGELWPGGIAVVQAQADAALAALHADIADAIRAAGLAVERRRWKPHVTLARRADGALPPADAAALAWRADGFTLVWSHPRDGYRPVAAWPPPR